uniref:Uncharacterized protein n=1 Tax=Glossina brevipalpis TaxID=37001 RepID=A0A1A9X384_9MUSC
MKPTFFYTPEVKNVTKRRQVTLDVVHQTNGSIVIRNLSALLSPTKCVAIALVYGSLDEFFRCCGCSLPEGKLALTTHSKTAGLLFTLSTAKAVTLALLTLFALYIKATRKTFDTRGIIAHNFLTRNSSRNLPATITITTGISIVYTVTDISSLSCSTGCDLNRVTVQNLGHALLLYKITGTFLDTAKYALMI